MTENGEQLDGEQLEGEPDEIANPAAPLRHDVEAIGELPVDSSNASNCHHDQVRSSGPLRQLALVIVFPFICVAAFLTILGLFDLH